MDDETGNVKISSEDTLDGTLTVGDGQREWVNYRLAKRPEAPEDALAVVLAWYDVGVTFHAAEDSEQAEALDANPMLERVDQGGGG